MSIEILSGDMIAIDVSQVVVPSKKQNWIWSVYNSGFTGSGVFLGYREGDIPSIGNRFKPPTNAKLTKVVSSVQAPSAAFEIEIHLVGGYVATIEREADTDQVIHDIILGFNSTAELYVQFKGLSGTVNNVTVDLYLQEI